MKIEVKEFPRKGIMRITTLDERWYRRDTDGLVVPAVTWVTGYAPTPEGLITWVGEKGNAEAERIRNERGEHGSKVHQAIEWLLRGRSLQWNTAFAVNERREPLTTAEYMAVLAFADWWHQLDGPRPLAVEEVIFNDKIGYAGTMDLKYRDRQGRVWLIDFKTSRRIGLGAELQLSAYRHAPENVDVTHAGVLQLMDNGTWRFHTCPDRMKLFLSAYAFWAHENKDKRPRQYELPTTINLKSGMRYGHTQARPSKSKTKRKRGKK